MSTDRNSLIREITLPDGVNAQFTDDVLSITGPLGSTSKDFRLIRANVNIDSNKITIESFGSRKKQRATFGTTVAHVNNLIIGVTEGYTYKLKTAFAHFPLTVKTEPGKIIVENFYGERGNRIAKVIGESNVSVKGDEIIISGINIEEVSQTAANLEQSTRIKNKDLRVYLDGIYLFEKGRGKE
jgi:large subunit ribosomal protein L6|tara:strand:- start:80 stop:631 length:552 start_codon:yes stop_codon:yes gene_type:complete